MKKLLHWWKKKLEEWKFYEKLALYARASSYAIHR